MGGIELRNGVLVAERELNRLDELAIDFSRILRRIDIEHVYIADYVSILAGRARSTDDVDVLIERIDVRAKGLNYGRILSGMICHSR